MSLLILRSDTRDVHSYLKLAAALVPKRDHKHEDLQVCTNKLIGLNVSNVLSYYYTFYLKYIIMYMHRETSNSYVQVHDGTSRKP